MKTFLEKLPLFALSGIFAVITYISQYYAGGAVSPAKLGLKYVLLVLCHNIIFYLYKIILPVNLSSYYAFPKSFGLSNTMVLAGVIGTCVLIPVLLLSLRWTRAALTGWLIFLAVILPTMGVVGFTIVTAADRFAYLPSVGLLMISVSFLIWLCTSRKARITAAIIVLTLAGAEAFATQRYLRYWQNSISLCEYMLVQTPDAAPVHFNLGVALMKQNRFDEAISYFYNALRASPMYIHEYIIHNQLGIILGRQGKFDEAVTHFNEALRLKPDFADAHGNLGYALLNQNEIDEAIAHFTRAVQLNPKLDKSHYYLAIALSEKGKIAEAVAHYDDAIRLRPNGVEPLNTLAWLLATHKDTVFYNPQKAVKLAQRACELTADKDAGKLDTLAAAYAAVGSFPEAIIVAEKALNLAKSEKNNQLTDQIQKRLDLYKIGRSYIEPVQK